MVLHRVKFTVPLTARETRATFYAIDAWKPFAVMLAKNGYEDVRVVEVTSGDVVYRPADDDAVSLEDPE
jgi:hypothetical protein